MQNSIHKDGIELSIKKWELEKKPTETTFSRVFDCFYRAAQSLVESTTKVVYQSIPLRFQVAFVFSKTVYQAAKIAKDFFYPEDLHLPGLSPLTRLEFCHQLDDCFSDYFEKGIPKKLFRSSFFQKNKKLFFEQILFNSLKHLPETILSRIQPKQVRQLFKEGYIQTLSTILSENLTMMSAGFLENLIAEQIKNGLTGSSTDLKKLFFHFNLVKEPGLDYLIETEKNADGRYTIELFSSSSLLASSTLDGSQQGRKVFCFSDLSEETHQSFLKFIEEIKTGKSDHLPYTISEFPDVVSTYLKTDYTLKIVSTLENNLFAGNSFLLQFRQQSVDAVFSGNLLEADAGFLSLLIAETAICYYQKSADLTPIDLCNLLTQIQNIETLIKKTPTHPTFSHNQEILHELTRQIQKQIAFSLRKKTAEEKEPSRFVIPPILWTLFDFIFSSCGVDDTVINAFSLGFKKSLGKDFSILFEAAKEEYLKRKDRIEPSLNLKEVSNLEWGFSLLFYGFIQFALYDLVFIATGYIFPPAFAYGALVSTLIAGSLKAGFNTSILPERTRLIAEKSLKELLFSCLPHLIEIGFYLFVSKEIKEELHYQLQLLDAFSFRAYEKPNEDAIAEKVIKPDEPISETALAIKARLSKVREEFHSVFLSQVDSIRLEKTTEDFFRNLDLFLPETKTVIEEEDKLVTQFHLLVKKDSPAIAEKNLVKFTEEELLPHPLFASLLSDSKNKRVELIRFKWDFETESFSSGSVCFAKNFRIEFIFIDSTGKKQKLTQTVDFSSFLLSLSDQQIRNWTACLIDFNPKSKKESLSSLLLGYQEFAESALVKETELKILTLKRLSHLSDEDTISQLSLWSEILKSTLPIPGFSPTKKEKMRTWIQKKMDPKSSFRIQLTLEQSEEPSWISQQAERVLPHCVKKAATNLSESLTSPSIFSTEKLLDFFKPSPAPKLDFSLRLAEDFIPTLPIFDPPQEAPKSFKEFCDSLVTRLPKEEFLILPKLPSIESEGYQTGSFLNDLSALFSHHPKIEVRRSELFTERTPHELLYYFDPSELICTDHPIKPSKEIPESKWHYEHPLANGLGEPFEYLEALPLLLELKDHYPSFPIVEPEDLFTYFQTIENSFKKQMRLSLLITSRFKEPTEKTQEIQAMQTAILDPLEKAILKMSMLYETVDHPFFSLEKWNPTDTNRLCRLIQKTRGMLQAIEYQFHIGSLHSFYPKNHSPFLIRDYAFDLRSRQSLLFSFRLDLFIASATALAESLIQREFPDFQPIHLYAPSFTRARENKIGSWSSIEKKAYTHLFRLFSKREKYFHIPFLNQFSSEISLLYEEPHSCLDSYFLAISSRSLFSYEKDRLDRWLKTRYTILPQPIHDLIQGNYAISQSSNQSRFFLSTGINSHEQAPIVHQIETKPIESLIRSHFFTESILETLLTKIRKQKRSLSNHSSIEIGFYDYILPDWKRFEKEIEANYLLGQALFEEMTVFYSKLQKKERLLGIFPLVFLDLTLKKYHREIDDRHSPDDFSSCLIEKTIYDILQISEIPLDTLTEEQIETTKILIFLSRYWTLNDSPLTSLLKRIQGRFFLQLYGLESDLDFLKKVTHHLCTLFSLNPSDYQIVSFTPPSILIQSKKTFTHLYTFDLSKGTTNFELKFDSEESVATRSRTDTPYFGKRYFPLRLRTLFDPTTLDLQASITIEEEEKLVIIEKQSKNLAVLKIDKAISDEDLSHAFLSDSAPYLRFPIDPIRLPPLLARFTFGKSIQFYKDHTNRTLIEVSGFDERLTLTLDRDQVDCSKLPGATLSTDPLIHDPLIVGNYLIFKKEGKRFALLEKKSLIGNILPQVAQALSPDFIATNFASALDLIPSLADLTAQIRFQIKENRLAVMALDEKGNLIPNQTDEFAFILTCSFLKNETRFEETLKALLSKIELNEPLEGLIPVEDLLIFLGCIQTLFGTLSSGKALLSTILLYLQNLEIRASTLDLEKKGFLFALTVPIYLSYVHTKYFEIDPLPTSIEAIFLNELDTLLRTGLSKFHFFSLVKTISSECLSGLIFTFFSQSFQERLTEISSLYPQHENHFLGSLKNLGFNLIRHSRFTHLAFQPHKIPYEISKTALTALVSRSLIYLPKKRFDIETFSDAAPSSLLDLDYQNLSESIVESYFYFFLALLFFDEATFCEQYKCLPETFESIQAQLIHRLETAIIPEQSGRQKLRFLQFIYLYSRSQSDFMYPLIEKDQKEWVQLMFSLFQSQRKSTISEGWIDWGKRELQAARFSYLNPTSIVSITHALACQYLPIYSDHVKEFALGADFTIGVIHSLPKTKRAARERTGRYACLEDLVEDNLLFESYFLKIADHYFTRKEIAASPFRFLEKQPPHKEEKFDAYFSKRIEDSYVALQTTHAVEITYSLKPEKSLDRLVNELTIFRRNLKEQIEQLSTEILAQCHRNSPSKLTIDELFNLVMHHDGATLLQTKLKLRFSLIELLFSRISLLALYQTYVTKIDLILKKVEKSDSIQRIAEQVVELKHYPITKETPIKLIFGCLFFEAKNHFWLRPLQAKQMQRALFAPTQSCVIEMIPGSGKTAFGILLDLYYRFEKGKASIAVFTPSLVTSIKKEVAERFYRLTGKRAFCLQVNRDKTTKESLKHLLHRFQIAKNEGDLFITTKEDLQALDLLLIENLSIYQESFGFSLESKETSDKIHLLKELLKAVQTAAVIVDECHEILKPDEIEKYPLGVELHLDQSSILGQELLFKYLNEWIHEKELSFEDFLKEETLYLESKKALVEKIIDDPIFSFSSHEKREIEKYLLDIEENPPVWLEKHKQKEILATARGALLEIVPNMKKEKIHTTYGLSKNFKDQKFVIPYSSNNTPIEGSIFESPYETLFKTYLYYLISPEEIGFYDLQVKLVKLIEKECRLFDLEPKETSIGRFFLKKLGTPDPDFFALRDHPDLAALLYVSILVAPTISFYPESIESTASDFASLFKVADYYSGTLFNQTLYPKGFTTIDSPETTAKTLDIVSRRLKESGKIISLSFLDPIDSFIQTIASDPSYMVAIDTGALFNGHPNLDVVKLLAETCKILRPEIESILFFDESNQLKQYQISTDAIFPYTKENDDPMKRLCYLDQNHAFGVDLPQKEKAGALITIGRNNLAQIEQACWRLRGLETLEQSISFALLPDTQDSIDSLGFSKETVEGVIAYLVKTEYEDLKTQSLQAVFQQIKTAVRKFLMNKIITTPLSISEAIFTEFKPFFIQSKVLNPFHRYGYSKETKPIEFAIDSYKEEEIAFVERASILTFEEKEEIKRMILSIHQSILPESVLMEKKATNLSFGSVCKQKTTLKEEVKEIEREKVQIKSLKNDKIEVVAEKESFIPWKNIGSLNPKKIFSLAESEDATSDDLVRIESIQSIFEKIDRIEFQIFSRFLRPDLLISENVIPFKKLSRHFVVSSLHRIFYSPLETTWNRKVEDLLMIQDKRTHAIQVIGLSVADSHIWEKQLLEETESPSHRFGIYKIEAGFCFNQGLIHPDLIAYTKTEDFFDLKNCFKIFNCSSSFSYEELNSFSLKVKSLMDKGLTKNQIVQSFELLHQIRLRDQISFQYPLITAIHYLTDDSNCASTIFLSH